MLRPRHLALAAVSLVALMGGAAAQTPPQPVFLSVTIAGSKITGVGTGAGTVAAGNDPRIVGAVQGPLSGDVATTGAGGATAIQPGVLTNTKLASMPAGTLKGNAGGSAGAPSDLTTAQVKSLLGYAASGANGDITSLAGLSTIAVSGNASIGGVLSISGSLTSGDALYVNDRIVAGHRSAIYRSNDTTRLWDFAYGDTIVFDGAGNVTIPGTLSLTTPLARSSGGTGATSLSAGFDAAYSAAQGAVLYRGASSWAALGPGTAGQVLASGGAGANPTWQTGGGNGTVTSVALSLPSSLFAVSGSPVTASGTLTGTLTAQGANVVWAGPSSGSAAVPSFRALAVADLPATADGCVRMSVQSTTVLAINPYGCNTLSIGGVPRTVTATTLTPSSPTASTLYYAYASWSGSAVTYSTSTTGHITGPDGREYANSSGTADTTRRLVGMLYTNASGQFVDSAALRGCLNWFGRRSLVAQIVSSGSTSSTSLAAIGGNVVALSWSDEAATLLQSGNALVGTASATMGASPGVDGSAIGGGGGGTAAAANIYVGASNSVATALAEGAHTFSNLGSINSGSATFSLTLTAIVRG